ncbi:MAG: 16S rRNA pseudouridine(516) synthase [Oscillospiraceae bacterium]|nr:16S rRNA pseudouridine(516) synthase [Oscillospiraceae bacterium]
MERLDKTLADSGRWTRREARLLVRAGRVTVDGVTARAAEEQVGAQACIRVDGEAIPCGGMVYLMLHKPQGVVSATEDGKEKTVLDLLPDRYRRMGLFPVGRLDKDTEGLLLLTNDGPLAHHLLAPRRHVDKAYYVRVEGALDAADKSAFASGLVLGDGLHCMPAELEILQPPETALITLHEGKYHQIKRMMAARGKPVCYLKRLRMGPLALDERLSPGAWRELTEGEKSALFGES